VFAKNSLLFLDKNQFLPYTPFFSLNTIQRSLLMLVANHIKPLGNRVLVKRSEVKATKGGILLPEAAQEKPRQGEVVAVGPGKIDDKGNLKPMTLNVGDVVLFSSYGGTEVKTEDGLADFLIMSEDDILGVLV
jgi:chaperonin GroES